MLEIPESHVLAAQIEKTLTGKTIIETQAATSPHGLAWYRGDPATYDQLLSGHTITGARSLGGQVEILAGSQRILLHDGIHARYLKPEDKAPDKHQMLIRFDDGSALMCTVQMYGGIEAYVEGENDNYYYKIASEKPSPLTEAFSEKYFAALIREGGPKLSSKALLATEQRIPGLGNGCLQDILFRANINPQTKMLALREGDMMKLFESVKGTLRAMTQGGGRDTEKDLFGQTGGYPTILSNRTYTKPCPVCGSAIIRKSYLGGNVYYCPQCQPVL
ncbi:MAG: endonuclease VIII [Firmicutes bacterium]|nr:endonuclease VIII [Bacillota bacterium]